MYFCQISVDIFVQDQETNEANWIVILYMIRRINKSCKPWTMNVGSSRKQTLGHDLKL